MHVINQNCRIAFLNTPVFELEQVGATYQAGGTAYLGAIISISSEEKPFLVPAPSGVTSEPHAASNISAQAVLTLPLTSTTSGSLYPFYPGCRFSPLPSGGLLATNKFFLLNPLRVSNRFGVTLSSLRFSTRLQTLGFTEHIWR